MLVFSEIVNLYTSKVSFCQVDNIGCKAVTGYPILNGISELIYYKIESFCRSFFHTTIYKISSTLSGEIFSPAVLLPTCLYKSLHVLYPYLIISKIAKSTFFHNSVFPIFREGKMCPDVPLSLQSG